MNENRRNMFISQAKNHRKKIFQKPNILRKKCKTSEDLKSNKQILINSSDAIKKLTIPQKVEKKSYTSMKNKHMNRLLTSRHVVINDILEMNDNSKTSSKTDEQHEKSLYSQGSEKYSAQYLFNVESFLNNGISEKLLKVSPINPAGDPGISGQINSTERQTKWCLDHDDPNKAVPANCDVIKLDGIKCEQAINESVEMENQQYLPCDVSSQIHHVFVTNEYETNEPVKHEFGDEEKLIKHKYSYKKPQASFECPVKYNNSEGVEEKCGKTFFVRTALQKHLTADHTLDDAQYKCKRCGRRFFFAKGLVRHGAARCGAGAARLLVCGWEGCGRAFRQPCRLREHARAHTGDRPYRCTYTDCGWAFRSASKLLRHSRCHTDERRHSCATCGRAFLRREHLRDHTVRFHAPHARRAHACPHLGCEQSFTNMSTLYMHMKKVHRNNEYTEVSNDALSTPIAGEGNMFVVSLVPEPAIDAPMTLNTSEEVEGESKMNYSCVGVESMNNMRIVDIVDTHSEIGNADIHVEGIVENEGIVVGNIDVGSVASVAGNIDVGSMGSVVGGIDVGSVVSNINAGYVRSAMGNTDVGSAVGEEEWHAARTHCTWPLPPRDCYDHNSSYVLEEDVQVEMSEGSESNIYTIRSDLFLHGNVLVNEDSDFVAGRGADDAHLALIDSSPTGDLMQEELMYTDAAVDESPFRVFLMNGDELT